MNADMWSPVYQTVNGTPYLKAPGVVLISKPDVFLDEALRPFLDDFDASLEFSDYLRDGALDGLPAEMLVKFAGQLCYMSFGPNRTKNVEAQKYITNLLQQKHGSVLEHANFTFLFYGIDRAVTHELVRHRAGFAYSQCSQRYVDGKVLRFVERPEFQGDEELHSAFLARIDDAAAHYDALASRLMNSMSEDLAPLSKRDQRKQVNQAARACLPNETEAPIVVTANARAWRHFLEMRASPHADRTICELAVRAGLVLKEVAPILFHDFTLVENSGRRYLVNEFKKV